MTSTPDDLALLTGDDAAGLLDAALAAEGGELLGWQARTVDARPGTGTTVSYRARVRFGDDDERTVWLCASTRPLPAGAALRSQALELSDGVRTVAVWAWPRDPWLPGLPLACDDVAVADLLTSFGAPHGPVSLSVHAYRPGRRAVVQGRSDGGGVFLKVQRPERVAALHARHRLLSAAGLPVPRSLGVDDRGLVALQALPGAPMRDRLRGGGPVPTAAGLLALLDRLPVEVLDLPPRPSWCDAALHYAAVVGEALRAAGRPEQADRAGVLAQAVLTGLGTTDRTPEPVHGDLYEAQLLLGDDGEVCGLLDVDSAGPGRRADDLGCLLGHLEVLATVEPEHAGGTRALLARWQAALEQRVDPRELRLRTAGVLLSLATGPHRVQERDWLDATVVRLDLVERWVAAAGTGRPPS